MAALADCCCRLVAHDDRFRLGHHCGGHRELQSTKVSWLVHLEGSNRRFCLHYRRALTCSIALESNEYQKMKALKRLFWSSRPISWVNTAYPFAAGYLVAGGSVSPIWAIGVIYFLLPYNLMLYGVNDIFDYESDLQNPRKKGLEGIVLQKSFHRLMGWAVLVLNIPFILYLCLQGTTASNIVLLVVIFMVLAYSLPKLRFKERPFLDSITSALHFVGPMLYGLVLVGWQASYWPYVIAFFAWGMASHAFGAVQDIVPDRKAGIGSIGTVIGARRTVRLSAVLYGMSSVLIALQGFAGYGVAIAGLLYVANVAPYWKITDNTSPVANDGWRRFMWLNFVAGAAITMTLIAVNL